MALFSSPFDTLLGLQQALDTFRTSGCAPLLLTAVVSDVAVLTVLWVLSGIGNALQLVANASFVQEVPAHLRGRAFGVAGTLLMVLQGVVLLVAGALAEATEPRVSVAVVALACLLLVPVLPAAAQGVPDLRRTIME